jgi:hypothetical protein
MEQWCGRSLRVLGTVVRMSAQDRRGTHRLAPCLRSSGRGLSYDLLDQVERTSSPDLRGKVLPAGEGREVERLDARILETVQSFSAVAGGILLGPIEPVAREVLALDQSPGDVHSRPVLGASDKALFATVPEEVLQSPDRCPIFVADDDRLVPSRPDLFGPAMEAAGFPGDVRPT